MCILQYSWKICQVRQMSAVLHIRTYLSSLLINHWNKPFQYASAMTKFPFPALPRLTYGLRAMPIYSQISDIKVRQWAENVACISCRQSRSQSIAEDLKTTPKVRRSRWPPNVIVRSHIFFWSFSFPFDFCYPWLRSWLSFGSGMRRATYSAILTPSGPSEPPPLPCCCHNSHL